MSSGIRWAPNGDVSIAYDTVGDAERDLLIVMDGFVPIDTLENEPRVARTMRRLSAFARLIRFDRRGVGSSDPISPHDPPTLEQWVDDAITVLDAAGSRKAVVLAASELSTVGLLLAAMHPDRIEALVLVNGFARARVDADYPGIPDDIVNEFIDQTKPDNRELTIDDVAPYAPGAAHDPEFRRWWAETGRRGASPATARALIKLAVDADVRAVVPTIRMPALLMSFEGFVGYEVGGLLASSLADATFITLPGHDDFWWPSDLADTIVDDIEEFLTGVRSGATTDRVLASVLFTDIVDSTRTSSELGDREWRDLLDRHDATVRRQIARFRGREVKTTGDGFLATFDGPARAIDCALAIRDATSRLGIDVRAGLHTGEVEIRGDDIGGIAVHIAARVNAAAKGPAIWVSRTVVDL
ncbi:MAG TPA: adenylate/guanylate cyclase domain-containing protein, partial [Acidimicrobiia bacterium]|nr:adenylate/guanylate cyclase domain-containing protein [Acidimicrobiia bacterium]